MRIKFPFIPSSWGNYSLLFHGIITLTANTDNSETAKCFQRLTGPLRDRYKRTGVKNVPWNLHYLDSLVRKASKK